MEVCGIVWKVFDRIESHFERANLERRCMVNEVVLMFFRSNRKESKRFSLLV